MQNHMPARVCWQVYGLVQTLWREHVQKIQSQHTCTPHSVWHVSSCMVVHPLRQVSGGMCAQSRSFAGAEQCGLQSQFSD